MALGIFFENFRTQNYSEEIDENSKQHPGTRMQSGQEQEVEIWYAGCKHCYSDDF